MMRRELGLDQTDLPHDFAGKDDHDCAFCGREKADDLHTTHAGMDGVEKASHFGLVTEKGS